MRERTCTCDRHVPGEPFVRGRDCGRCWRWHNDPTYREGRSPPRRLCAHLGEPIGGYERQALGLDHRLDWRQCELGVRLGDAPAGVVCRCRGCGPACPSYSPADPAA